jgi:hypothetical protein
MAESWNSGFVEPWDTVKQCKPILILFGTAFTDMKIWCMELLEVDSRLPRPCTSTTVGLAFHHFSFTAISVHARAQMISWQHQYTGTLPFHPYRKRFVVYLGVLGYYTVLCGRWF